MAKSKSFKSLSDLKDLDLFKPEKLHTQPPQTLTVNIKDKENEVVEEKKSTNLNIPNINSGKQVSTQGTLDQELSYLERVKWITRREYELSSNESKLILAQKSLVEDGDNLNDLRKQLVNEGLQFKIQLKKLSELNALELEVSKKNNLLDRKILLLEEKEKNIKEQEKRIAFEKNEVKKNQNKILKENKLHSLVINQQKKDLKDLTFKLRESLSFNKSLIQQTKELKKNLVHLENQVESLEVESSELLTSYRVKLDNWDFVQYLIKNGSTASQLGYSGKKIAICGDGPWLKKDFDVLLKSKGFLPVSPANSFADIAIVGRDFSENEVECQLIAREGKKIHFYSQELLIASIAAEQNPLNNPESYAELLNEFSVDHPGLLFLKDHFHFPWPLPNISDSVILFFYSEGLVDKSPLVSMGYHVGIERGLDKETRRNILLSSFNGSYDHLKNWYVDSDEYMARWGRPNSRRRLFQMSNHIHSLIITRRSNPSMRFAVQDWKDDVSWLKKFYKPYMGFKWPILK